MGSTYTQANMVFSWLITAQEIHISTIKRKDIIKVLLWSTKFVNKIFAINSII